MIFFITITLYSIFYKNENIEFVDGVSFSPSKKCENIIIKLIQNSSEQIDITIFDINNINIVNELKSEYANGKK